MQKYEEGLVIKEKDSPYTLIVKTDKSIYSINVIDNKYKPISALKEMIFPNSTKIRFKINFEDNDNFEKDTNYFSNDKIGAIPSTAIEVLN